MKKLTMLQPRIQNLNQAGSVKVPEINRWGSNRGGRPWRRKRLAILIRDKYTCQQCGYIGADLECDHIINLAVGGDEEDTNLQALCKDCHSLKTAKESNLGR